MRLAVSIGLIAGLAVIGAVAHAGDKPAVKVVSCAEQWQAISSAAKPDKAAMKTYAAKCASKAPASRGQSQADRMKESRLGSCNARWAQMKAANALNGQSYEDFSAQCLNGTPRT